MKLIIRFRSFLLAIVFCTTSMSAAGAVAAGVNVNLPQPSLSSSVSIEQALAQRRSLRTFSDAPVALAELSQLLWAAQGITETEKGLRTAPSGLAKYPLRVYAIALDVTGLPGGVYRYEPGSHKLILISAGDVRDQLKRDPAVTEKLRAMGITAHKDPMVTAAAAVVITGDNAIARNPESFYLEAGHAAQNVLLQCVSLGLGGVPTASFKADVVTPMLELSDTEVPVYMLPVGKKL